MQRGKKTKTQQDTKWEEVEAEREDVRRGNKMRWK